MHNRTTTRSFTLVEMLVVVGIVALISSAVVALSGGLTTQSAITLTLATQKQLTSQVNQFYQGHGKRMPDGFDSLLRDDWATTGGGATYTPAGPLELVDGTADYYGQGGAPRGLIYTGFDADQDTYADDGARSQGLTFMSWTPAQGVHTLTVAKLTASDLAHLNTLGITRVYDVVHDQDLIDGQLTYVERELVVDDPIVILDPDGWGDTYETFTNTDGLMTLEEKLTSRPHFIVMGIGPNCTMIGDRLGGLQEAPECNTVISYITATPTGGRGYYNRYMAVIKIPAPDSRDEPSFAGILEANGWGARSAAKWYARNRE